MAPSCFLEGHTELPIFCALAKSGIRHARYLSLKTEGAGAFRPLNESLKVGRGFNPGI